MAHPRATLKPQLFTVSIPQTKLDDLALLIKAGRLPPATHEGTDPKYGVTNEWMKTARDTWADGFDWRKHEARMNAFPNFTVVVKDDDDAEYTIHYIEVVSSDPDAIPIVLFHGWPGSILEFLDIIPILAASTNPSFHIVVPSGIGYGFSSKPLIDRDFNTKDVARLMDKLMVGLGFKHDYIVQGGDIGAYIARIMAVRYNSCRAVHLNFNPMGAPEGFDLDTLTELEKAGVARSVEFAATGSAYFREHDTRPSTIGHVLASNPLALLAWIGEKFLEWTDESPSLDEILAGVTLYWLTESFPTGIFHYRAMNRALIIDPTFYIHKPLGYSAFPKEIMAPAAWVGTTGNLVYSNQHDKGGHFSAMEQPQQLAEDIIAFVRHIGE